MSKPHILSFETYQEWDAQAMQELFTVHQMPASGNPDDLSADVRESIVAFAFKGHSELGAATMDAFPNLKLVANFGVGYDTIDVEYAASKGIAVTNTPDVLTDDVADLAVGMYIALSRDITGASEWVTSGSWVSSGAHSLQRKVSGSTVGIVGLGRIGHAIAQRLHAFDCDIHYFGRSEKDTPGWTFHADLVELASTVEVLIVAVSASPDTAQIVSQDVLDGLGSEGMLINISRGATVDEAALLDSLETGKIQSAALDVFNNEPNIDPRFLALDNVLLQPHHSSATFATRKQMGQLQRDNLQAFFAGKPLVTPVT